MKLVLVEWLDSAQPSPGWRWLTEAPDLEVVRCQSVGWLVAQSDVVIMLAPNMGDIGSESGAEQACGFIRIPAAAVTRMADLREATCPSCCPFSRPGPTPTPPTS